MPLNADVAQLYYTVMNCIIALGMASVAMAFGIGLYRKKAQHAILSLFMGVLFGVLCVSRYLKAFDFHRLPQTPELIADTLAALLCIVLGFIIWPVLTRALKMPSYQEIEKTNQELEYWEKLFETFMEHSPAVAFLLDAKFNIIYVNNAFEKHFDVKREDVIGKPHSPDLSEETIQKILAQNERVMRERKPVSEVLWLRPAGGREPEPYLTVKFPVFGNHHNAAIGGFTLNVSAAEKMERAHAQLAAIVESSQDAIIGKDLDGNIVSWNTGAEELYGWSAEEIVGKHISTLVPSDRKNEVPMLLDKLRRGVRVDHYETVRLCKNGKLKHVSLSLSPIRANGKSKIVGAAVIARDISEQKHQEQQIKELNKQLSERVYELAEQTAALQAARDQALEASSLKSAFVANISHEIRTPLSGILGLNEMLLQSGNLKGDDLQVAQMVQQSAEALLGVLNDILDLSKIEAGKITLEYAPFNPVFLLQDCTRLMAPTAHQKGLHYELTVDQRMPDMVYGDVSRLRQILLNLIGNAVKFTAKGSVQVRADVKYIDMDRAEIEVSVKDSGIGISPEHQRLLFHPFQQIDNSSTRKFGGTGLGLTISKRFVEMMGGKIGVTSERGKGSTFWLRLTLDRNKLHHAQDFSTEKMTKPLVEPVPATLAMGRRVLIVEDNAVLQTLVMRQLNSLGIEAEATAFGRDAIEMAMSDRFDIVLMDINLPDITGLEATAAIRNLEHSSQRVEIPIIAMTAGAMKGDRERAIAAGMNDYMSKPVPIENLKRTVELWLRKSKIRQYMYPPADVSSEQQKSA